MKLNIEVHNAAERTAAEVEEILACVAAEVAADMARAADSPAGMFILTGAPTTMRSATGEIEATYDFAAEEV